MFGSLNDFIDIDTSHQQNRVHVEVEEDDEVAISPLSKYSRKKVSILRKKRTMSGVESYKASDKAALFQNFSKNFPHIERAKKLSQLDREPNHVTSRQPISESKLSSLFYGQNPTKMSETILKDQYGSLYYKMQDQVTKSELKRQHNLLRAIVRTKMNQQQKITNTHYEDSFNRMSSGLKNIKIRPNMEIKEVIEKEDPKTTRSLNIPVQKRSKSRLSNKHRIQFQNCLNWTKKRNKNGSFYAEKLGKIEKAQINTSKSVEKRKEMLKQIHNRSNSVSLAQNY